MDGQKNPSPAEKAEKWHRRSIVAVSVSAVLFVATTFVEVPSPLQILLVLLVTGSAFWLMITTMWLFTVRSEIGLDEDSDEAAPTDLSEDKAAKKDEWDPSNGV